MFTPCVPACNSTPVIIQVPGPQGATGVGINAYTTTTSTFVIPAVGSTVTIPVVNSSFMAVGQYLYITDGTSKSIFQVSAIGSATSITGLYINDPENTQTGNTMGSNANVTPAGANGLGLNLNQIATVNTVAGLTQAITASFVQIGAIAAVVPAAGKYFVSGFFSVDWAGVTFSSSRTITAKCRNTTSSTDYGSISIDTQVLTTATFPTSHYYIPPQRVTLNNGDTVQIWIEISVINSAGTLTTTEATLTLLPTV